MWSEIVEIIVYIFLGLGVFFNLLAGLGLLRFPDVYTRLHAGTKCTTFGSIFICGSVIILGLKMWIQTPTNADGGILMIHTAAALVAILLTNPTGAHAIARAAHRSGVKPAKAVVDDLAGKPITKKSVKNVEEEVYKKIKEEVKE